VRTDPANVQGLPPLNEVPKREQDPVAYVVYEAGKVT